MEATLVRKTIEAAYPQDLLNVFSEYEQQISILSLDCFDTLLWRAGVNPFDVFYDMQELPSFKEYGISAFMRIRAEEQARQIMFYKEEHYEVSLLDIYQRLLPEVSDERLHVLMEDEIRTEMNHCYAFPLMVDLIKHAKNCGKKVIIVSNIYFTETQLRRLLSNALAPDVLSMIDHVFCSYDYKKSKSNGLFKDIIDNYKFNPAAMLHIGDNKETDYEAAKKYGLSGVHFIQQSPKLEQLLRMQTMAATVMIPDVRHQYGLSNLFRSVFAASPIPLTKPETITGYMSIGPVMYAFSSYLCEEIKKLTKPDKNLKIIYLMRDAYILAKASEHYVGKSLGKCIRISRATAISASLRTPKDIEDYVGLFGKDINFESICRQLSLPPSQAADIINQAKKSKNVRRAFIDIIKKKETMDFIIKQCKRYSFKLKRYLEKEADLKPNDELMIVDVGYAGTVQRSLKLFLKEDMGIDRVYGRYLISLNPRGNNLDFSGLLDLSWCDYRSLVLLSAGFVLMEELFSSCDDTVVNYNDDGSPVYAPSPASELQRIKIKTIQNEAYRFIEEAKLFFTKIHTQPSARALKQGALIDLGRILYLPLEDEVNYLQGIKHEINAQTDEYFDVFQHPDLELDSLRRKGLYFKNQHPYGLRSAGLELVLTVMAQRRFEFDVNLSDMSLRSEYLTCVIIKDQKPQYIKYKAKSTHDGYFSCWIPLDCGNLQIAILLGMNYEFVQLQSVDLIKYENYLGEGESKGTQKLLDNVVLNHMINKGNTLYECVSTSSSLMLQIPSQTDECGMRITIRPIVNRDTK